MEETSLLSLPEGMCSTHIQITEQGLVIEVKASHPTSCCPLCAHPSDSIKTHYRRMLRDAPCAGRQVQLVLTVRKFYCRNRSCLQKVFAERLPTFVEPWARMTNRCCQHITSMGLATCGKGGARLAARLGIQTTRPTALDYFGGTQLASSSAKAKEKGLTNWRAIMNNVDLAAFHKTGSHKKLHFRWAIPQNSLLCRSIALRNPARS